MAIRTGPPLLPNKPAAIVFAVLIAVVSIGLKPWPVLRALWLGGAALLFYALRPAAYTPVSARIGSPFRRGLLTTRATPSNTPAEVTHVFIGSGLSSLTSAALLARTGAKCLVLEQHDVVGGGTHSYELGTRGEGGPWKFDSGLHYTVPESELLVDMCTGKTGSAKVDLMGLRESEIPKWAGGKDGNVANKGPIDFSPGAKEENIVCGYSFK